MSAPSGKNKLIAQKKRVENEEFTTKESIQEGVEVLEKSKDPTTYFGASYLPGNHPYGEYVESASAAREAGLIDGHTNAKGLFAKPVLDMDKFKSYSKSVQDAMFTKDFDAWIETKFLSSKGPQAGYAKEWIRKVYPDYFNRREKQYQADRELEDRLAKLNLFGITDFESLFTQFMMDRGLVDYDRLNYPLWNPLSDASQEKINSGKVGGYVVRGMFNPKRYSDPTFAYGGTSKRMPFHFDGLDWNRAEQRTRVNNDPGTHITTFGLRNDPGVSLAQKYLGNPPESGYPYGGPIA